MNNVIDSKAIVEARIREKIERRELPHLYAHKFYPWMQKFWDSMAKIDVVVCANQVGKSSTSIRRMIRRITEPALWPAFWPNLFLPNSPLNYPSTHWYLYPTMEMATREFQEKWKLYLPRGSMKDHPQYGWREVELKGFIHSIEFNVGPTLYFLSYAMGRQRLQATTCHSIGLDEEPPQDLFDEVVKRISASEGYMAIVFTSTEAQNYWVEVVETKKKIIPGAFIQQVSLFDCQTHTDGTPSIWTAEKIQREIDLCSTERQVQRRVYGRIVKDEGLKYETFDRKRNLKPYHPAPRDWLYYAGIDSGGGGTSHPAAIGVIAVSPEYDKGRLCRLWRGDGIITSAEDILNVYRQIAATLPMPPVQVTYDWAAKDLFTIGSRMGLGLVPAEKGHAIGEHTLNTLFKNGALVLFTPPEKEKDLPFQADYLQTDKVIWELESLSHETNKNKAKDDAIDGGLRYIVTKVPWDWEKICGAFGGQEIDPSQGRFKNREEELRYDAHSEKNKNKRPAVAQDRISQELKEWDDRFQDDFGY